MKSSLTVKFLLFVILPALSACTDHLPPQQLKLYRVTRITQILPDQIGITNVSILHYEGSGNLDRIYSYQTPDSNVAVRSRTSFTYNSNQQPLSLKRIYSNSKSEEYKFTYREDGLQTGIDYDAGEADAFHMTFQYTGNRITGSKKKFDYFSSISYERDLTYQYTYDNISRIDAVTTINKTVPITVSSFSTFTFDDKLSPFYGYFVIPAPGPFARPTQGNFDYYTYYGGLDNFFSRSANNALTEVRSDGSKITYTYEYGLGGLPSKRITTRQNRPQDEPYLVETLLFEYEKY